MTAEQEHPSPPAAPNNFRRLRLIIVCSIFLLLASLTVFSIWDGFEDYQTVIKNVEGQSKSYARALKEHAERTFSEVDLVIQTTVQQIEAEGGLDKLHQTELHNLITTVSSGIPQIGSLAVA
ncbi:hypothetical protein JZU71_04520, partial [bacterium]|nr:hypothetical protein [bacterium]